MIAVDTNVLVRLLVDEPSRPDQVTAARKLASEAGRVHVPLVVLVEMVWVLAFCYQVGKPQLLEVLAHLLGNEAFDLEAAERCTRALALFQQGKADFSDCVILAGCARRGLTLYTFDKRLGRMEGACLSSS